MSRKQSREQVFHRIYALSFDGDTLEENTLVMPPKNELEYMTGLYTAVTENLAAIDELIRTHAKDFAFDRIFKIDLALLRLGIGEGKYTDIPSAVAINAVVDLAKKYSTEKSVTFVNGVLAKILQQS